MKYKNLLLSTGIGDFLAIDSFLNDKQKKEIQTIYFVAYTFKQNNIKNIIKKSKKYNENIKFLSLTDIYIHDLNQRKKAIEAFGIKEENTLFDFEFIWGRQEYRNRKNIKNYLFKNKLDDISKFKLPKKYCVIFPYTNEKRCFNKLDWMETNRMLNFINCKGVILGNNSKYEFYQEGLINLNKKTNVTEAIEITKNCSFYLGVDSFLSIVASYYLSDNQIQIKTEEKNASDNFNFYFPNKTSSRILKKNIDSMELMRNFFKLL